MELNLLPENPLSAANLSSAMVGSAPGDRMKMSGAQQLESANDFARSNGGGSTKFLPSFSVTKFVTAGTTCTDRILQYRPIFVSERVGFNVQLDT